MQLGILLAIFGTAMLAVPNSTVVVLATFLVGFGSGPCVPAASDLLQRHAPRQLRALIFSIKQAGVPLGGVLAGFLLPPLALIDWRLVILATVVVAFMAVTATQPFRGELDRDRDPSQKLSPAIIFSPDNLMTPMRALRLSPLLTPLAYASFCLALAQSATFAFLVTFAVMRLGFDLLVAAMLFAVLQVAGIAGRVLLGAAADWLGSAKMLVKATVIASAITTTLFAFASPEWPLWTLWALIGITGVTVASWNGLVMADIADIVPPERMAETATGVSIVLFAGSVIGPIGFALVLDASGSYQPAFLMLSAWSLSAALFFMRKPR